MSSKKQRFKTKLKSIPFRHGWSYIDEVDFFRYVEPTPELIEFKRDLALKQLIN